MRIWCMQTGKDKCGNATHYKRKQSLNHGCSSIYLSKPVKTDPCFPSLFTNLTVKKEKQMQSGDGRLSRAAPTFAVKSIATTGRYRRL